MGELGMYEVLFPDLNLGVGWLDFHQACFIAGRIVAGQRHLDVLNRIVAVLVYSPDWDGDTLDRIFWLMRQQYHFGVCASCRRITFTDHRFCPLCASEPTT